MESFYISFCTCLLSLHIMFLRLAHVATYGSALFVLPAVEYSIVGVEHN